MKSDSIHLSGTTCRSGVSGKGVAAGGKKYNLRNPLSDGRERAETNYGIRAEV
jgi:hypothetical protein